MSHNPSFASSNDHSTVAVDTYDEQEQIRAWTWFGALLLMTLYPYCWSFYSVSRAWYTDPLYSHGYLIPLFTVALLWMRRQPIQSPSLKEQMIGVGFVFGGVLVWCFAAWISFSTLGPITLVPCLLGYVLIVGGWKMFRWAGPPIAFLLFMNPLPRSLVTRMLLPMQTFAAMCSNFALQTLGIASYREGTQISINDRMLEVVGQCSGLRMATVFLALGVAMAMILNRPLWHRLTLVVSTIPVAIFVNIVRITLTGLAYAFTGFLCGWLWQHAAGYSNDTGGAMLILSARLGHVVDHFSHNMAGLLMMPIALGLLYLEVWVLDRLFVEDTGTIAVPTRTEPLSRTPRSGRV